MTFVQIEYFLEVARLKHFRKAAEKLAISQPSLSKSIANLEAELGVLLFAREGRHIELTKYGREFYSYAIDISNKIKECKNHMVKFTDTNGHIDIAYVFPLAHYYIPSLVRSFLDANKNMEFSFHQGYTEDLIAGLISEKYDVIFSSYEKNLSDIVFEPVLKQNIVAIVGKDHPLSGHKSVTLDTLTKEPIIGYDKNSGLGKYTNQIYKVNRLTPNIICQAPDEHSIAALVASGFGCGLVADVDSLKLFPIEKLTLSDMKLTHTVYMAYKKNGYQISAVKKFISFVKANS